MRRFLLCLALACGVGTTACALAAAPYSSSLRGDLAGYHLAGIEPDGDPLYQTVMNTSLAPSGGLPPLHLIVNAYLENFKPDTTPILPDLLHPKRQAQNLGGFLQGKALITDDAGAVISIGGFVAEAFLDNSNSAIMSLYAGSGGYGVSGRLQGRFTLHQTSPGNVSITGHMGGKLAFSPAVLRQVRLHAGHHMKPIEKIISQVTVTPHAMVGRATAKSRSVPLRTGFNGVGKKPATATPSTGTGPSTITIVAAIGAAVSFLLALILFLTGRKRETP